MTPILRLDQIDAFYGPVQALSGVSLDVRPGEIVSLLGGNASGKSTTMKTILGVVRPWKGSVAFNGARIDGLPTQEIVRRGIALVPEARRLFGRMTVLENLAMGAYTRRHAPPRELEEDRERVFALFPRLKERRDQLAGTMSGGEQQMLAMARGLASNPAVLLLDELSMGLAPIIVEELYGHVARIAERGISVLVVEQFARTVLAVADYAALMLQGRVRRFGTPQELDEELSSHYLGMAG